LSTDLARHEPGNRPLGGEAARLGDEDCEFVGSSRFHDQGGWHTAIIAERGAAQKQPSSRSHADPGLCEDSLRSLPGRDPPRTTHHAAFRKI
jgi:hypothetical protein